MLLNHCEKCGAEFTDANKYLRHVVGCTGRAGKPLEELYSAPKPERKPTDRVFFTLPWRSLGLNALIGNPWEKQRLQTWANKQLWLYELENGLCGQIEGLAAMKITVQCPTRHFIKDPTNLMGYAKIIEDAAVNAGILKNDNRGNYEGARVEQISSLQGPQIIMVEIEAIK